MERQSIEQFIFHAEFEETWNYRLRIHSQFVHALGLSARFFACIFFRSTFDAYSCFYLHHTNDRVQTEPNEMLNEADKHEDEEEKRKQTHKVCIHTTINYLVISLQAANKFNHIGKDCRFLAMLAECVQKRENVLGMAWPVRYFHDYMCSF